MKVQEILSAIKQRKYKPLYLLHGEESHYIDVICDAIESTVLNDAQKGFDQTILYGKDVDFSTIISAAKRYPMMSDYQVIIIKEAQGLKWKGEEGVEMLAKYVENLTPTTILLFAYKHGKFDKRTKLYKAIEKAGIVFESEKLYDNKVAPWIVDEIQSQGRKIHPQAAALMAEYLGTDLSKVANEVQKLILNVSKEREISVQDIEQNIGISKDFNVFELNNALGKRDALKAIQIVDYFAANPKSNPVVLVMGTLYGYFSKVLKYHYLPDKSTAAKELGVNPYFVKDYEYAARNFNKLKLFHVMTILKDYDLKFKGLDAGPNTSVGDLLREMIFKILN
ncbi:MULTISPECIES: DNA polymerase III subunit delta [Sphingobacterium]|uniref:DNA polymerase III subunit delta n=1 Tax=Sphingobacterium litopenaei TaxID=2763500 RepID=A0ABR7YID6_9SPHI|nr:MULTISPECIES: DNA polymerase III subunit delta [Sphingobacterium]MBD1431095.1 DNA polymerase III subunit delta [Sphingobacterium litopenaei]NGM73649.1 DNA polymerase III subunit delta [Sphingobacterium sp. SGL-16]